VAVDLQPTEEMAAEAERGLDWREEFGRGGTAVGVARARDISNRVNLSPDTVRRMVSYFARHEVDKQGEGFSPGEEGYPSAGRIAWALWGGDPGQAWANRKAEQLDAEEERAVNVLHSEKCPDTTAHMDKLDHIETEVRHVVSVMTGDGATVSVTITETDNSVESETETEALEAEDADEALAPVTDDERPVDAYGKEPDDEDYKGPGARKGPTERLFRTATFERASMVEGDRRVTLAFSSEAGVDRAYGVEVLDHSPGAMNSSFIGSGRAPLLVDHDMTDQVGVVEGITLGVDRVARATVRFGRSARAEEILQDVRDGIRSNVSVGYIVDEMVQDGERDGREVYRATSWTPLEISIVSIPADASVGVGRALDATTISTIILSKESPKMDNVTPAGDAGMKAERERAAAILELGSRHNQRDFADQAIRDGASVEQFRGALLDKVSSKPLATADIGLTSKEVRNFSFARAIHALANPTDARAQRAAAFEFEASEAAASKEGRASRGLTVPADVLFAKRDILTGTGTGTAKGGNLVATDLLAGSFIDVLRARMVTNELGATFLTGLQGNVAIPKKSAASTVAWVAENSAPSESTNNPAFSQVTLSPKTLAGFVDFSRRLMLQSSLDIESLIRNDLATSIAVAMDNAAVSGSGSNRPTGVLNTSGIGSVTLGTNGAAPTWAMVTNLVREVEIDNALTGSAAFLTNGQVKSKLSNTARQSSGVEGNFILQPPYSDLYGYRFLVSQQVPANLTKGSGSNLSAMIFGVWSDLIIGQWSGIDLMVDPYSGSNAATVRVTAFHDCDFAVRNAESFAECNEIVTT
jgi:HK97 family phage major capsid protein/HK97 family phage prohead protease